MCNSNKSRATLMSHMQLEWVTCNICGSCAAHVISDSRTLATYGQCTFLRVKAIFLISFQDDVDFAHIKIQLNLWKTMKTSFENLRVSIPFLNRYCKRFISRSKQSITFSQNALNLDKHTIAYSSLFWKLRIEAVQTVY